MEADRDQTPPLVLELLASSGLAGVGAPPPAEDERAAGGRSRVTRRKAATTASRFKAQLADLCKVLGGTGLHYIRCVKPNTQKSATTFDRPLAADQLRRAGVVAAVEIARTGYPTRMSYQEFRRSFGMLAGGAADDAQLCRAVLERLAAGGVEVAWLFGKTKIFFKVPPSAWG